MKQRSNDIAALHQKSSADLMGMLEEMQLELAKARLARAAGKLEDTASVKLTSDAIARVKTVLREQQLAARSKNSAENTEKTDEKSETKEVK